MENVNVSSAAAVTHRSNASRRRRVELAGWLLLTAVVFLGCLGRAPISKVFEARVADTATTMARAGWPWAATPVVIPRPELSQRVGASKLVAIKGSPTVAVNPWLVPVFEGEIRLQKPPLPYWCAALLDRCLGERPLAARLVPATLGALSGALIYLLGLRVGGRRVAIACVAIWTSSHFAIDEHRKAMADPYLAAFSLAAIVAWIEASSHAARRGRLIVLFYLALAGGAMAKGPVVFLHVGVALLAFAWCRRRRPRAPWAAHLVGVALFAAIALPWPLYILSHVPGAIEIWRFESIGEFADNQRNARPWWFYVPQLILIAAPWTAFAIAAVVARARRWDRRRAFAVVWSIAIVAVFSASHMKKNAYLLPLLPAVVLLIAGEVRRTIALARRRPRDARPWTIGHAILGVIFAALILVASIKASLPPAATIAIATLAIAASLVPLWLAVRDAPADRWFRAQAFAFALMLALFIDFPQTARQNNRSDRAEQAMAQAATSAQP